MHSDAQGLQLTTASTVAAAAYDAAVDGFCGFKADPVFHVKAALEADPNFALAHCLRGYAYLLMGVPAVRPKAIACLEHAESGVATPREHGHFLALQAWCDGDLKGAAGRWEHLLIDHPTDLMALRMASGFHFNAGDCANLRDSVARVRPSWDGSVPGYGYVLSMYAFGLEECGAYAQAEATGRQAVDLNPADIWAVHAVAHVMEMQGRTGEGIAWLDDTEAGWAGCNFFAHHVWWHKALYHIEQDNSDAALALYDKRVRDDFSDVVYDIHDAAALLWRLELADMDVGRRWDELADKVAPRIDDHFDNFTDAHFMMCLAGGGRRGAANDLLASMHSYATTRRGTVASIMRDVGVAACEGLAAFRAGAYDRAVDKLLPIRYALHRIGGSHAQRDLFAVTLIEAALRGGRSRLARALAAERCAAMPESASATRLHNRAIKGLRP